MNSEIKFSCTNVNCEKYNQEILINEPNLFIGKCDVCYTKGNLKIKHNNEEFDSTGALVQYFRGLSNELKLLKRLIDSKIASKEEINREKEISNILLDAICPCCGKEVNNLK